MRSDKLIVGGQGRLCLNDTGTSSFRHDTHSSFHPSEIEVIICKTSVDKLIMWSAQPIHALNSYQNKLVPLLHEVSKHDIVFSQLDTHCVY